MAKKLHKHQTACFEPSCHAGVVRDLRMQDDETQSRHMKTITNAKRLNIALNGAPPMPKLLNSILRHAIQKAKHCKCNRLACPSCGMVKFMQRVHRVESNRRVTAGYLSGGVVA